MTRLPALVATLFLFAPPVALATTNHLVISEVQIGNSESVNNEYVELFNPTATSMNLTNLRLQVGTTNLVSSLSGTLESNHYYLIAKPVYTTLTPNPDTIYSASSSSITANSYITLFDADHSTIIDRLGMGMASLFETSPAATPSATLNLHRTDICNDSDNNSADFSLALASPQNSSATFDCSPSPTPTFTPTPTVTPTPTASPTPTPTFTPTPTNTPTSTPLPTPSPTSSPIPTQTPTLTPTPTPPPSNSSFLTCSVTYRAKTIFGLTVYFPKLSCHRSN